MLVRLVQLGDQPDGVVEHRHHVREGVPEEARDPDGDVDPGPAQLRQRDHLQSTTRREASSQTGSTPISASTSAMSSPQVRMAEVPQTDRPTDRG